jgi:hypothetical protein
MDGCRRSYEEEGSEKDLAQRAPFAKNAQGKQRSKEGKKKKRMRRDLAPLDRKNPPFAKGAKDGAPVISQHVVPADSAPFLGSIPRSLIAANV